MKKFIIGLSPRFIHEENNDFIRVASAYNEAVKKENIVPLIIMDTPNLEDLLNLCDGFIIIGGNDIDPIDYNESNDLNLSRGINRRMDEIDKEIILHAKKHNKPMLGICRGIQAIAVYLGGSLHQDLNHANISHPMIDNTHHMVKKVNNYGVAKLLPDEFMVNTYHHQAVKQVPNDFLILYQNADTIEMIESTKQPILAVQWHPEKLINDKYSRIIFDYFYRYFK